jgi:FMN-dependent NADH-azoreductase
MKPTASPILLRVDTSPRQQDSFSRRIADGVQRAWLSVHPHGRVVERDLARHPLPHIEAATIKGYYTPAAQMTPALHEATALSDALIAELKAAHTLLVATPLYNFSLPSALKAWIDQIVRIGHTFSHEGGQFRGLVQGPRAVLALAYGAGGYQGPLAAMDHLRPCLESLLSFIGINDVRTLAVEATTGDVAAAQVALDAAIAQAPALFAADRLGHAT